jgi:hypothetical protein
MGAIQGAKMKEGSADRLATYVRNPELFWRQYSRIKLRRYQMEAAMAIIDSIKYGLGLTFCVVFPRQSGKNEVQAQIEAYLLAVLSGYDVEIVKVQPTWKPQALRAMKRLEKALKTNLITKDLWSKESGYIYQIGKARIYFLSAALTAHVVGATANCLLEADEAQDVNILKWDKEILPMAASTNATRVLWGTAWTKKTLLARETAACLELEKKDQIKRVFRVTADEVSEEVTAYRQFVEGEVRKFGRGHPIIKTQYYCEDIDEMGGMFSQARMALMFGEHEPAFEPEAGKVYCMTVDVAGSDETKLDVEAMGERDVMELEGREHDCTAITVFEVDLGTLDDAATGAVRYKVVYRLVYQNMAISEQQGRIKAQIDLWQPYRVVVDATGIGAGLFSTLHKAFGEVILPFVFTAKSKSDLAWSFLAVIDTGRYKEYRLDRCNAPSTQKEFEELDRLQRTFRYQMEACSMTVKLGPAKLVAWGVGENVRHPENYELMLHDDLLVSAALAAVFEEQTFGKSVSAVIEPAKLIEDRRIF